MTKQPLREAKTMKKFKLIVLGFGLMMALVLPARSFTIEDAKEGKMYIGGWFTTDMGWQYRDKDFMKFSTGINTDNTNFFLNVPVHSALHGSFEVGQVGGFWEFGMGGQTPNASGSSGLLFPQFNTNAYVETRKLFGYYKFGNFEIRVGKDDRYCVHEWVPQFLGGMENLHWFGYGWGAVYDTRDPQIRFTHNVNKQFGYMITLLQAVVLTPNPAVAGTPTQASYSPLPRLAVKGMLDFGWIRLYPAFQIQNAQWDNLQSLPSYAGLSPDDNVTSWLGILPIVVRAGAFTGKIQAGYGQNAGVFYGGFASPAHFIYRDPAGRIKNTTDIFGFVSLGYNIGPAYPSIYLGYDNAMNSDEWKVGNNYSTRLMYGASVFVNVVKSLTPSVWPGYSFGIAPEIDFYDYGSVPGVSGSPTRGKEAIFGVQFMFWF
jgi:hypothetical protein